MRVAPTFPLVIGCRSTQAKAGRRARRRSDCLQSSQRQEPRHGARLSPRDIGNRCRSSGITTATAKHRGTAARGNPHRSKKYRKQLTPASERGIRPASFPARSRRQTGLVSVNIELIRQTWRREASPLHRPYAVRTKDPRPGVSGDADWNYVQLFRPLDAEPHGRRALRLTSLLCEQPIGALGESIQQIGHPT